MPQIDQIASIYASQLFWLVVVFGLIYFGIGRAMLPKIERTVDDRDAKISGDLAAAEAARAEADAAEAAHTRKLDESRAEAAVAAAGAKARAVAATEARIKESDAQVHTRLLAAERHLEAQRHQAILSIEAVAAEAAQEIVGKIAGLSVDRDAADRAVRAALAA